MSEKPDRSHRLQCRITTVQHTALNKAVMWGSQGAVLSALLDVLLILSDRDPGAIHRLMQKRQLFVTAVVDLLEKEVPRMSLLEEIKTEISQLSDEELAEMLKGIRTRRSALRAERSSAPKSLTLPKLNQNQLEALLKMLDEGD